MAARPARAGDPGELRLGDARNRVPRGAREVPAGARAADACPGRGRHRRTGRRRRGAGDCPVIARGTAPDARRRRRRHRADVGGAGGRCRGRSRGAVPAGLAGVQPRRDRPLDPDPAAWRAGACGWRYRAARRGGFRADGRRHAAPADGAAACRRRHQRRCAAGHRHLCDGAARGRNGRRALPHRLMGTARNAARRRVAANGLRRVGGRCRGAQRRRDARVARRRSARAAQPRAR